MQANLDLGSVVSELVKQIAQQVRDEVSDIPLNAAQSRLLTVEQAASYIGRSKEAMQHMVASGKVPVVRFDRRISIDIRDLEQLIAENKTSPAR